MKIKTKELNLMSAESALQLMIQEKSVANRIRKGIVKTKYELYPGCRAILYIYTNRSKKEAETEDETKSVQQFKN